MSPAGLKKVQATPRLCPIQWSAGATVRAVVCELEMKGKLEWTAILLEDGVNGRTRWLRQGL